MGKSLQTPKMIYLDRKKKNVSLLKHKNVMTYFDGLQPFPSLSCQKRAYDFTHISMKQLKNAPPIGDMLLIKAF